MAAILYPSDLYYILSLVPGIGKLEHDLHEDVAAGSSLLPLPSVHIGHGLLPQGVPPRLADRYIRKQEEKFTRKIIFLFPSAPSLFFSPFFSFLFSLFSFLFPPSPSLLFSFIFFPPSSFLNSCCVFRSSFFIHELMKVDGA